MARVIGYVKSLEQGTFFVKDAKGNVHQLKVGEAIHEGELVYGAPNNSQNAKIIIDVTIEGMGDLLLAGNQALNFDTSLLKGVFVDEDAILMVDSLKRAMAINGFELPVNGEITEAGDETAAGESLSDQERPGSVTFSDRTGLVKDVNTVLNEVDTNSVDQINNVNVFRPVVLDEGSTQGNSVDDTAPTVANQTITYSENQAANATVGTLAANADVATYTFANGTTTSDDGFYTINNAGVITITALGAASAVNDFESGTNSGDYAIIAKDTAGNPTTLTVTLKESDVDDTAPTVANQTITYSENQAANATVGTLAANADVATYTFANGTTTSDDGFYTINNAGVITITALGAASAVNDFESGTNSGDYAIIAKDTAGNPTTLTVTLKESDVDDTAPTVANQTITYSENQAANATVGTLAANADVATYTFANGTTTSDDGFYTINNAGVITITALGAASAVNDFESGTNSGDYAIIAKDTAGNPTTLTVTLKESDVDDTAPTVANQTITYSENQAANATVGTLAANADVATYTFANGTTTSDDGFYTINNAGVITITALGAASAVNDFESGTNSGDYAIIAKDTAGNPTTLTVTLKESDVDDTAPTVANQTITYSENQAANATVGTLAANADVATYTFANGTTTSDDGFYTINNAGVITITALGAASAVNDFESGTNSGDYAIIAKDTAGNPTTLTVTLKESDVDDTAPTVANQTITYSENQAANATVGTLAANADVATYTFANGTTTSDDGFYTINNAGVITITALGAASAVNDFESGTNSGDYAIIAKDTAGNPTTLTVTLKESDVDDTAPTVANQTITYSENQAANATVGTLAANADVATYTFANGTTTSDDGFYTINNAGVITITALGAASAVNDFESGTNSGDYAIIAKDTAGNPTTLTVTLKESDVDDTAPTVANQTITYSENQAANATVGTLAANADVATYTFANGTTTSDDGFYTINNAGVITITALGAASAVNDFESGTNSGDYAIIAKDTAGNPTTLTVTLKESDVDDTAPTVANQTITYSENQAANATVGTLAANADVATYTFANGTTTSDDGFYTINNAGVITITALGAASAVNDFESGTNSGDYAIIAKDTAGNPTTLTVTLKESDVDDTAPTVANQTITYSENQAANATVGTLAANADVATYTFANGTTTSDDGFYTINNAGVITITALGAASAVNDFESGTNSGDYAIIAKDTAGNPTTLTVTLKESDVDDTAPTVANQTITYSENQAANATVGTLAANADVATYTFANGTTTSDDGFYTINNAGVITITALGAASAVNDFESGTNSGDYAIIAKDTAGNPTTLTVTLKESDVDDTAPTVANQTITYSENQAANATVGTLAANADVATYTFANGTTTSDDGFYTINNAGVITITALGAASAVNDFESGTNSGDYAIIAKDTAGNPTTLTVTLKESDVDDTAPTVANQTITYSENQAANATVGTLAANADVATYTFANGTTTSDDGFYTINNAGVITITALGAASAVNDFESGTNSGDYAIIAKDTAGNPTTLTVTLKESDVDDTAPTVANQTITYSENQAANATVGTLAANADVATYTFANGTTTSDDGFYTINNAGVITITALGAASAVNDFESGTNSGDYAIIAKDTAGNPTTLTVTLKESDVDDTAPTVANQTITYSENQAANATVGTLAANADVATYTFANGTTTSDDGFYTINNAGVITITALGAASAVNDFESGTNSGDYAIIAKDTAGNPTTLTVTLKESDVDDTAPTVANQTITYSENQAANATVGTLAANADVATYTFANGTTTSDDGFYTINNAGVITITALGAASAVNDFESGTNSGDYAIIAKDTAGNPTTLTVTLKESDVDDTAPTVANQTITYSENQAANATVGTLAANADVATYTFANGTTTSDDGFYTINNAGVITITALGAASAVNDFESGTNSGDYAIIAKDTAGNPTTLTVTLKESDVDDTAPTVANQTITYSENQAANATVGTLAANADVATYTFANGTTTSDDGFLKESDVDDTAPTVANQTITYSENQAANATVGTLAANADVATYTFANGTTTSDDGFYTINNAGVITITALGAASAVNDFESGTNSGDYAIIAKDTAGNPTTLTVTLKESDVDDTAPTVANQTITYSENQAANATVGTLAANADVATYTFANGTTTSDDGFYTINNAGVITITALGAASAVNDFESGTNSGDYAIIAKDTAGNPTTLTVTLKESDVDDTAPTVANQTITYSENQAANATVGTLAANADVATYTFANGTTTSDDGFYTINNAGVITITALGAASAVNDFESGTNSGDYAIIAKDTAGNPTTLTVTLKESDVDDTAPTVANQTITYSENQAANATVGTLAANADVATYTFANGTTTSDDGFYTINNAGVITITALGAASAVNDFESGTNSGDYAIIAKDTAGNPTTLTVTLKESDVDDTAPTVANQTITYSENQAANATVGTLAANADVATYTFANGTTTSDDGFYTINNAGVITITALGAASAVNDFESGTNSGDYAIIAKDTAGNPTTLTVTLKESDVDDTAPTVANQTITYSENQAANATVGTLAANADVATYTFANGTTTSDDGFYTINNAGVITITALGAASAVNDFESGTNSGDYAIIAKDTAGNPTTLTVTLKESDVDDTAPTVANQTITYSENQAANATVGTLAANADVATYTFANGTTTSDDGFYTINNAGVITITALGAASAVNDFESGTNSGDYAIIAKDTAGNPTTLTVTLKESDVDDTAPTVANQTITYSENQAANATVGTLAANADVATYTFANGTTTSDDGFYTINNAGVITITALGAASAVNDFESGTNSGDYAIIAKDTAGNPTTLTVTLKESDVDDTAPTVANQTITYSENQAANATVGTLAANADVATYTFANGTTTSDDGFYTINNAGVITITALGAASAVNDFESGTNSGDYAIIAKDTAGNPTTLTVTLKESDVDDTAPTVANQTITYSENQAANATVGTLAANADVATYTFANGTTTSDDGFYTINNAGVITITALGAASAVNDFESGTNSGDYAIIAKDTAGNPTTLTVTLKESDVDDTAPTVANQTITYSENQAANATVGTLAANADVATYTFANGTTTSDDGFYTINNAGVITITALGAASAVNDFESGTNSGDYAIIAKDTAGNPTTLTVTLKESDVDDTAPTVANQTITYSENQAANATVGTLAANADVATYTFANGTTTSDDGFYTINNAGVITITALGAASAVNDFESGTNSGDYAIIAKDTAGNPTTLTVTLKESDVDDTAPTVANQTITYSENQAANATVGTLAANADVATYTFANGTTTSDDGFYTINNAGVITITALGAASAVNDFESGTNSGDYAIIAKDTAGNPTTLTVTLKESDVDDTAPTVANQTITYSENQAANATVGTLAANADVATYTFANGTTTSDDGFYTINNAGVITITALGAASAVNDFESGTNSGDYAIIAKDTAGNPTTLTVTLKESDVDDTAPTVANQTITYSENQAANATVGTLAANADVATYTFANGTTTSDDGFYTINNAGVITITALGAASAVNDFESGTNSGDYAIIAKDTAGNPTTLTVTLKESDVDDTAPTVANQTITYSENQAANATVGTLAANADVATYTFANGTTTSDDGFYTINNAGVITITALGAASAVNDFESGTNSGDYAIIAKDTAGNPTTLTVTLKESDVIDTAPTPPTLNIVGEGITSQSINISNISSSTNGFSVTALAANGSASTISTHSNPQGFGVAGVASGDNVEIGYLNGAGSEKLVVHFDYVQSSIEVSFAWKNPNETALVEFYRNGILVGSGTYKGGSDAVDPAIPLQPSNGAHFDEVRFGAVGSGDDYLIHSIDFDNTGTSTDTITMYDNRSVELHVSSALVDTGSSETLMTTISGLPVGFVLSDGIHVFTATAGSSTVDVTDWNQASLIFTAPINVKGTVELTVTATATNGLYQSSTSKTIDIVIPVEAALNIIDDNIITNAGSSTYFTIPEWALLYNDTSADNLSGTSSVSSLTLSTTSDDITLRDSGSSSGGSFSYSVTDTVLDLSTNTSTTTSDTGTVTVSRSTNATLNGTTGDDIMIAARSGSSTLNGGDGNDILIGGTSYTDTLNGGAGDDVLVFDSSDTLNGGTGTDTMILSSSTNIDFSALANDKVTNMEVIDLTINGSHNITNLSLKDVIDMTDSNNTLTIIGDSADSVNVPQADGNYSMTQTTDSGFDVYTYNSTNASDPTVVVKIEQDITHS
jgi:hypothetical protein